MPHTKEKSDIEAHVGRISWRQKVLRVTLLQAKRCQGMPANHQKLGEMHGTESLSPRNKLCQHRDFRLPASRTVRHKFLLLKPPSLWPFVTWISSSEMRINYLNKLSIPLLSRVIDERLYVNSHFKLQSAVQVLAVIHLYILVYLCSSYEIFKAKIP